MTPAAEKAVKELRQAFPGKEVRIEERADGCWVMLRGLKLGRSYKQRFVALFFLITSAYPDADIYPMYTSPAIQRKDGRPHGQGLSDISPDAVNAFPFKPRSITQISQRRQNIRLEVDTAAAKAVGVLNWLKDT